MIPTKSEPTWVEMKQNHLKNISGWFYSIARIVNHWSNYSQAPVALESVGEVKTQLYGPSSKPWFSHFLGLGWLLFVFLTSSQDSTDAICSRTTLWKALNHICDSHFESYLWFTQKLWIIFVIHTLNHICDSFNTLKWLWLLE